MVPKILTFSGHPLCNLQTLSLHPVGTNQRQFRNLPETLSIPSRDPSETLQTPFRHPPDTHQTPSRRHLDTHETPTKFQVPSFHKLREMIRQWVGGWSHLDNRAAFWPNLQAQAIQDFSSTVGSECGNNKN